MENENKHLKLEVKKRREKYRALDDEIIALKNLANREHEKFKALEDKNRQL